MFHCAGGLKQTTLEAENHPSGGRFLLLPIAALGTFPICGYATAPFFPRSAGVNPSLTIQVIACRTADRIKAMAARGEL